MQQPLLVLLYEYRADQAANAGLVGEDADHVRALSDFLVEPLQRMGRMDFEPVGGGEVQRGQPVGFGLIHQFGGLWEAGPNLIGHLPPSGLGAFRVGLDEVTYRPTTPLQERTIRALMTTVDGIAREFTPVLEKLRPHPL